MVVPIRLNVCVVAVLMAMSLMSSSRAFAQIQGNEFRVIPKKDDQKIDFLYRASRIYLFSGVALDGTSTAYAMNASHGVEAGWARCFGNRNSFAAVSGNVLFGLGVDMLSRNLKRRGGRWRAAAIGLNLFKGTGSMVGGVHNIRYSMRR